MNKTHRKLKTGESGLALIALVAIIVILGVVSYTFVSIISSHRLASTEPYKALKALYITEGALEIGKKYVSDRGGTAPPWAPDTVLFNHQSMGDGNFTLAVHWPTGSTFVNFTALAEVP
jgi:hypothetical protein